MIQDVCGKIVFLADFDLQALQGGMRRWACHRFFPRHRGLDLSACLHFDASRLPKNNCQKQFLCPGIILKFVG